jgi:alkyl-hydroperoxide reductase/thiol specific antioxidant family protein
LRGRRAEIEAAGAELVFVGNGSVAHARRFREKHVPESCVYTDPDLTAYTALGFRRSVGATLGPSSAVAFARASLRGHRQTSIEGDAWQQGGLIVMAPGGELLHVQRFRDAGGRPDVQAALAALGASSPGPRRRPKPRLS